MASVRIHADDFGLTNGINNRIRLCWQQGLLHSVSIIPNGYAFDEAIQDYLSNDIKVQVHLNFVEGYALSPLSASSFFALPSGRFHQSFASLFWKSSTASKNTKKQMKIAIQHEIKAQILKVKPFIKPNELLRVDSHQHVHMIPLFFDALCDVVNELGIDYIRIPSENIPIAEFFSHQPASFFNSGWMKVLLLSRLSGYAHQRIKQTRARYNSAFIGIISTGQMNLDVIEILYRHIQAHLKTNDELEILLHPGKANLDEKSYWDDYPHLKDYYFSACRDHEADVILSDKLKSWYNQIILPS